MFRVCLTDVSIVLVAKYSFRVYQLMFHNFLLPSFLDILAKLQIQLQLWLRHDLHLQIRIRSDLAKAYPVQQYINECFYF